TAFENLTQTASHEISEAVTDPLQTGWFLPCDVNANPWDCPSLATGTDAEVADLCNDTRWNEASYVWTRFYAPTAGAPGGDPCLPSIPDPYETAVTPMDWYPVMAGRSISIPVTGESLAGATASWNVDAFIAQPATTPLTITFTATTLSPGET